MKKKQHETVGWLFEFCGAHYRCTRYVRSQGFWMRLEQIVRQPLSSPNRAVGDETCVSERAIGRTYHMVWGQETPAPHIKPCECYVCRGED